MNDTIYAGYYTTELLENAEHTYAIVETPAGETVTFDCYGGTTGENNRVPATLYTGTILKTLRRSIGKRKKANLFKARCIAQFSYEPARKEHYELKPPFGLFGLGDNAGIVYAVTGVCHQMTNRILHAMDYRSKFSRDPGVVWPPSFDLSRILYLNDGAAHSQIVWRSFLALLPSRLTVGRLQGGIAGELHEALRQSFLAAMEAHLRDGYTETASREILGLMLPVAGPKLDQEKPMFELLPDHRVMLGEKLDLDRLLLQGRIEKREYADGLNDRLARFVRRAEKMIGAPAFKAIFGFTPGASIPRVVAVADMPDIDGYERLGKQLRL